MGKHTKGPWIFSGNWVEAPNAGAFRVRVAIVDDGIGAVPEHNGPLMAAAPDLLEALQHVVRVCAMGEADLEKALAAIAKAEGRGE